jgi:hypothetical protein
VVPGLVGDGVGQAAQAMVTSNPSARICRM